MKQNFSNLSPQIQLIFSSVPVYVSSTVNPDEESSQQTIARQEIFLKLRKGIRWKLASFETGDKIRLIGQKYQFELLRLANITRLIREYYFGEVRFENFPAEIEKRMGVSLLTAQEISRYIKQEIIDWDPWAEYLAKLPKMPIREIVAKHPKIAETEITAGYIELKGSQDLEDPSIKNWIKDYISHLGYDRHSQMDRTQYIFHSENGKNLSSQDREKLGIILKSFDENIPLPVDEENGEIVFDGIENVGGAYMRPETVRPAPATNTKAAYPPASISEAFRAGTRPLREEQKPIPQTTNSFIKPYAPILRPTLPPRPQPTSPQPSPYKGEGDRPAPQFQPAANIPDNFASPARNAAHNAAGGQTGKEEISKYFSAPESLEIPEIKIHSITEHNEPKMAQQIAPRPTIQRPMPQISPQPSPYQGEGAGRPKYKIIDPFFSKPRPEPRLDGNIVDLSDQ